MFLDTHRKRQAERGKRERERKVSVLQRQDPSGLRKTSALSKTCTPAWPAPLVPEGELYQKASLRMEELVENHHRCVQAIQSRRSLSLPVTDMVTSQKPNRTALWSSPPWDLDKPRSPLPTTGLR